MELAESFRGTPDSMGLWDFCCLGGGHCEGQGSFPTGCQGASLSLVSSWGHLPVQTGDPSGLAECLSVGQCRVSWPGFPRVGSYGICGG